MDNNVYYIKEDQILPSFGYPNYKENRLGTVTLEYIKSHLSLDSIC